MSDTPPEIRQYLAHRFAALSARERLLRGFGLIEMGWKMAEIAVKKKDPQITGRALQLAVFRWMYRNSLRASMIDAVTIE